MLIRLLSAIICFSLFLAALPGAEPTAGEVLQRAVKNRAVWREFPGFECRLTVRVDGQSAEGRLAVASDGELTWSGFPAEFDLKGAKDFVGSLIQHRLSATGSDVAVEFAADDRPHPLGRLLKFSNDERLHSSYRIHDDVIGEVNRTAGDQRFTISVLDVHRNAEGKYLPQTYAVAFWDRTADTLRSTETHINRWTRLGPFDLPQRALRLRTTNAGNSTLEVVFQDHRLTKPAE